MEILHSGHPINKSIMKRFIYYLFIVVSVNAYAETEKKVKSEIEQVTVFLQKAQIERSASLTVPSGKSEIIFEGLSHSIDPQSIQVSGKGGFIILGVKHQNNYLQENEMPSKLRVLMDSLKYYSNQLIFKENSRGVLIKEEALLLANQKITGTGESITAAQLKEMADFFRKRMNDISLEKIGVEEDIRTLNSKKGAVQKQINEWRSTWVRNSGEIVVSISSKTTTKAMFNLSYLVNNAGWSPSYDIRATNVDSPIQLNYKANVYQNSGIDWKDVNMVLSTSNPTIGGFKPTLNPWYLDFIYNTSISYKRSSAPEPMEADEFALSEVADEGFGDDGWGDFEESETVSSYTEVVETSLNTRFNIALKYTILTGGKPELVEIQSHNLEATYQYSVAPKLEKDAFLLAYITGWESLSLLPGEANIYFEGTYINKSYIDPNNTMDTLDISLGRDKKIIVQRKNITDFTTRKTIGSKKKVLYIYEIELRNAKSVAVNVQVEDQIPISRNKEILVELISKSGASYDQSTGKLSWDLILDPNQSQKLSFEFEVQYPKDKKITNL